LATSAAPSPTPTRPVPADPLPGDVGCVPIHGDVGWLISVGERLNGNAFAQYDHAFVYVGDGQVIEAEPGGAREADLSEYDPGSIAWIRCPDQYRQAVAEAARELKGVGYSAADYFALALHRFHLPAPWLRTYVNSSKHEICSQLCVTAARRGGWKILPDSDWSGYVTPADLAALAEPPA
jgi:uncharacterized protein YycO